MVAKLDRTGEENINNFGSKMEVINYRKFNDIDVYIEELTGIRSSAPALIRDMNKTNKVKSVVDIDKYR